MSEGPGAVQGLLRSQLEPEIFSHVNESHCEYLAKEGFTSAKGLVGITRDDLPYDLFSGVLRLQIPRAFSPGQQTQGAQSSASAFDKSGMQKLNEMHEYMQQQRARELAALTIAISDVKTEAFQEMKSKADITLEDHPDLGFACSKIIPRFGWDERLERAQADRYILHLSSSISLGSRQLTWVDAANRHPQLLTCDAHLSLGRKFRGTTDAVVCSRSAVSGNVPALGMHMLFELKKGDIIHDDVIQAMVSLMLANLHAPSLRPMMILTDLNDYWQLMWLDESCIHLHLFPDRTLAAGFIEASLAGGLHEARPEAESKVGKRRKLADRIAHPTHGSGLTIPDGAADVLSPAELTSLHARHMLNLLEATPLFASARAVPFGMYA